MLKNNTTLKQAVEKGDALFGTLDTWLIYRLTGGQTYCTDVSVASSTGMFDPYLLTWSKYMKFFGIPISMMPHVCESAGYHLGEVSADIWGKEIPIACSVSP